MDEELEREGRVWFRGALQEAVLADLDALCAVGAEPGARLALSESLLRALAAGPDELARSVLPGARPVRAVAFNKSEDNNWALGWHQDRVVVAARRQVREGYANWTRKAGLWHVEPPIEVLADMVFMRIHLDPADRLNGCMQVALGSHRQGKVLSDEADAVAAQCRVEDCVAARGDVLIAKALLLHRSSASRSTATRRALRLDYRATALAPGLE